MQVRTEHTDSRSAEDTETLEQSPPPRRSSALVVRPLHLIQLYSDGHERNRDPDDYTIHMVKESIENLAPGEGGTIHSPECLEKLPDGSIGIADPTVVTDTWNPSAVIFRDSLGRYHIAMAASWRKFIRPSSSRDAGNDYYRCHSTKYSWVTSPFADARKLYKKVREDIHPDGIRIVSEKGLKGYVGKHDLLYTGAPVHALPPGESGWIDASLIAIDAEGFFLGSKHAPVTEEQETEHQIPIFREHGELVISITSLDQDVMLRTPRDSSTAVSIVAEVESVETPGSTSGGNFFTKMTNSVQNMMMSQ